jgi:glycosyltransferase involved in cell wall biosynthesis
MLFSIVIPTYKREEGIRILLDSIIISDKENKLKDEFEIIVVKNDKETNIEQLKKEYPMIIFIEEKIPGSSQARNAGVKIARGEYLVFLDDDEEVERDWVNVLISILKTNEYKMIAGEMKLVYEKPKPLWIGKHIEGLYSKITWKNSPRFLSEKEWSSAGHMIIESNLLKELGGFPIFKNMQRVGLSGLTANEDRYLKIKAEKLGIKTYYSDKLSLKHYIPEERTEKEWVIERSFNQGISDFSIDYHFFDKKFYNKKVIKALIKIPLLYLKSKCAKKELNRFESNVSIAHKLGYLKQYIKESLTS